MKWSKVFNGYLSKNTKPQTEPRWSWPQTVIVKIQLKLYYMYLINIHVQHLVGEDNLHDLQILFSWKK